MKIDREKDFLNRIARVRKRLVTADMSAIQLVHRIVWKTVGIENK
jgi:hypothetical protein